MKRSVKILTAILAFCLAFCLEAADCRAAQMNQEPYTYTLTLRMGKNGTVRADAEAQIRSMSGGGLGSASVTVDQAEGVITVSGLGYKDRVVFQAQALTDVPENGKYYAKGVRQSGHDDSNGIASCEVTGDRDYVVAYGVRGDMVSYVVNYQDTEGNTLAESNTYYGNVGDKPRMAYLYIEGYQPQAYNLTQTLKKDPAENVFTFVYVREQAAGEEDEDEDTTEGQETPTPPAAPAEGTGTPGEGEGTTTAAGPAGGDGGVAVIPGGALPGGDGAVGADAEGLTEVPDGEVPQTDELVDLDDEEVPLTDLPAILNLASDAKLLGIPIPLIVASLAILGGGWYFVVMKKRKKKEESS